jgi:hypothetical protein
MFYYGEGKQKMLLTPQVIGIFFCPSLSEIQLKNVFLPFFIPKGAFHNLNLLFNCTFSMDPDTVLIIAYMLDITVFLWAHSNFIPSLLAS